MSNSPTNSSPLSGASDPSDGEIIAEVREIQKLATQWRTLSTKELNRAYSTRDLKTILLNTENNKSRGSVIGLFASDLEKPEIEVKRNVKQITQQIKEDQAPKNKKEVIDKQNNDDVSKTDNKEHNHSININNTTTDNESNSTDTTSATDNNKSDVDNSHNNDEHKKASHKRKESLLRRAKRAVTSKPNANGVNRQNSKELQPLTPVEIGISLFNQKPQKGIDFLVENGILKNTAESIAEYLHLTHGLDKFKIGEYVGGHETLNVEVLNTLVTRLNFENLDFDIALRHMLYCFRLPGEAQKIDRVMNIFGTRYFECNPSSIFANADSAQIMAFALIMLTTDAHNPKVVDKMTKDQFIHLNRGMNNGIDFPKEFLAGLYDSVVDEPLIRIDHNTILYPFAVKRGWLYIYEKRKWNKYYCLLDEGNLHFCKRPMSSHTIGKFPPTPPIGAVDSPGIRTPTAFCFKICIPPTSKDTKEDKAHSMLICADNQSDMESWIGAIFNQAMSHDYFLTIS